MFILRVSAPLPQAKKIELKLDGGGRQSDSQEGIITCYNKQNTVK